MIANDKGFCRVPELHYLKKSRPLESLHTTLGVIILRIEKIQKLQYWTRVWFYMKADVKGREKFKNIVKSPMRLNFILTRTIYNMGLGSLAQVAQVTFGTVIEHISTQDLVHEFLANKVFPTLAGWGMLKPKEGVDKGTLVILSYRFKEKAKFKGPCFEWLEMIVEMCNEILDNFTKKEDQLMTVAFKSRGKCRLNRFMDAL